MTEAAPPLILLGFMGSGKSTVARLVSRLLRIPVVDLDKEIEGAVGCPISHFFQQHGEAAFRKLEHDELQRAIGRGGIIATGGGIVTSESNQTVLQQAGAAGALVIYLQADAATLARRIRQQPGTRPLIDDGTPLDEAATRLKVDQLLQQREPLYLACAGAVVGCGGVTLQQVVQQVRDLYLDHMEKLHS